ncbi:hypothetical protein [Staphylococcus simulans]|uniref:hypothetical protein n=1 Tax=Staphylococcus simulans TaxID=1286 RepID=UPI0021D47E61|nr:hypothetical protein [Staphylococcus simulans]UXR32358.1 hypothetical protein MUA81_10735 [Staphylococcus simulans]
MSEKKEDNKKGCLGCLGLIVLVILLFAGCGALFDDDEDKPKSETEKQVQKQVDEQEKKKKEKKKTEKTEVTKTKEISNEEKLINSIQKEVSKKNFNKLVYNEYDKVAVITLEDYSGFSKGSAVREMQGGAGKALLGVKNSKLGLKNVDVNVKMKTEDKKMNKHNDIVLKMSFDKELISNLNKDNLYKIREDAESYATDYWLDPNFK